MTFESSIFFTTYVTATRAQFTHHGNMKKEKTLISWMLHRNLGPMPPDELHNQLPWSYFNPRQVPMKPPVVEEELERPPVPVPDYTLHFGKTNRPSASNWSEDNASSPTTSSIMSHHSARASSVDRNNSRKWSAILNFHAGVEVVIEVVLASSWS